MKHALPAAASSANSCATPAALNQSGEAGLVPQWLLDKPFGELSWLELDVLCGDAPLSALDEDSEVECLACGIDCNGACDQRYDDWRAESYRTSDGGYGVRL